jgi:hypothetical protein
LQQLQRALQMNDDPRRVWGYRDWDWTWLIMSGGLSHETTKLALANEHAHVQNAHHPLNLHSKAQLQKRLVTLLEGLEFRPITLRFWNGALSASGMPDRNRNPNPNHAALPPPAQARTATSRARSS